MSDQQRIQDRVNNYFIESHDFNGITGTGLSEDLGIEYQSLLLLLKDMVEQGVISIQSGVNPHIIRVDHYSTTAQLSILKDAKNNISQRTMITDKIAFSVNSHEFCVYPSVTVLNKLRDVSSYLSLPFSRQLALGEPHLKPAFFDIEVLDRYYRDPRFRFDLDDYSGKISYAVDSQQNPLVRECDRVFMESFGIGHDEQGNRLAVVFLRYLHRLTPEHQIYWKSKERTGEDCKMVKEYYDNKVFGSWNFSHSIFSAFIQEQKVINDLSLKIFGANLFKRTFENEKRPKEFTFFFIPTLENYNGFVLLLDKMISDNIENNFFKDSVDLYDVKELRDGQKERQQRGTLRLLKEWLAKMIRFDDPEAVAIIMNPLIEVRRQRQHPAHRISENDYDQEYIAKQKALITGAYNSLRQIRNIFQQHPLAAGIVIPDWLENEPIKSF